MRLMRLFSAFALAAVCIGCQKEEDKYQSCQCDTCPASQHCLGGHRICVPVPDSVGTCPEGYTYNGCASDACCEFCRVCVHSCIPNEFAK